MQSISENEMIWDQRDSNRSFRLYKVREREITIYLNVYRKIIISHCRASSSSSSPSDRACKVFPHVHTHSFDCKSRNKMENKWCNNVIFPKKNETDQKSVC
jgi:hypothetical protein